MCVPARSHPRDLPEICLLLHASSQHNRRHRTQVTQMARKRRRQPSAARKGSRHHADNKKAETSAAPAVRQTKPSTKSVGDDSKSYHLIFTPGFLPSLLFWIVIQASVVFVASRWSWARFKVIDSYEWLLQRTMMFSHEIAWWSLISLLSSSCCALQLLLNLFSVGCAGFNTVLGPLRPFFIALAFHGQIFMWSQLQLQLQIPRAILGTAITAAVTFMPEALYMYTHKIMGEGGRGQHDATVSKTQVCQVGIKGMACIACVHTIKNAITSTPGVSSASVSLKDAKAIVSIEESANESTVSAAVMESISDAGFDASPWRPPSATTSAVETDAERRSSPHRPMASSNSENENGSWSQVITGLAAGLLSSSCCLLQLGLNWLSALNVVHVGCAGFNKSLGPLRPFFRSLSAAWLLFLWARVARRKDTRSRSSQVRRLALSTLLTVLLAFLPELLKWAGGPAIAPPTAGAQMRVLNVQNMGCEACESAVRRIIDRQSGVVSSSVDFKAGVAHVMIAEDWHFTPDQLHRDLEHHGYGLDLRNISSKVFP